MKEFTQRIKLVPFINSQLRELKVPGGTTDSKTAAAVKSILIGRKILPVNNTNSHNYKVGIPLNFTPDARLSSVDKAVGTEYAAIFDVVFERVIPGGNHLRALDCEIEVTVDVAMYIEALNLLKQAVQSELEYVNKLQRLRDNSEETASDLLKEALLQPYSKIDLLFLEKLFHILKNNKELKSSKIEFYR